MIGPEGELITRNEDPAGKAKYLEALQQVYLKLLLAPVFQGAAPEQKANFAKAAAVFKNHQSEIVRFGVQAAQIYFNPDHGHFIGIRLTREMTPAEVAQYPTQIDGVQIMVRDLTGLILTLQEWLK